MIGRILSDRRKSIGMSIDQLVEKSGVPRGTLTKILTGVSPNPSLETAKAITYALGLTLNDLVRDEVSELSPEALSLAHAFDAMSDYGKAVVRCVLAQERATPEGK